MKKITLILFMMVAVATQAQILYQITGNGLKHPSYLLGTYHLAPASFADSIPGFNSAFNNVEQVCGELQMDNLLDSVNMMKMQNAMMLPEGKTIQSLLTADEMNRLNALTKELMGVDFSNAMVAAQLGKFTPAALTTQFSVLMYMKEKPDFASTQGIDDYVQRLATEKGKKTIGLESIDDQMFVIFKSQTLERQKQLLMCMVDHKDYEMQLTRDLVSAYQAMDLNKIESLTDMKFNDQCDSTPEEEETLIYGRNKNWMKSIPSIISEHATLIAVGAAHLVGEEGLLSLLRQKGYEVKGVK